MIWCLLQASVLLRLLTALPTHRHLWYGGDELFNCAIQCPSRLRHFTDRWRQGAARLLVGFRTRRHLVCWRHRTTDSTNQVRAPVLYKCSTYLLTYLLTELLQTFLYSILMLLSRENNCTDHVKKSLKFRLQARRLIRMNQELSPIYLCVIFASLEFTTLILA